MNERIQELAMQAGYLPDGFGFGHWDMPECKKFAELIVKECIKVVDDTMTENQEINIGLVMASAAIVAYFGVE